MIRYQDAELTSVLPTHLKDDCDIQAISYAFQMATKKTIYYAELSSLLASIDKLDEGLLDLIALELGTQYYSEGMEIEKKRKLIKNTLAWYKKAGTPSAVAELIEVVFGEGKIVEWFDYTEPPYTPHTFEITTNATTTEEMIDYFLSIIKRVKNTRSHIRRILSRRRVDTATYTGTATLSRPHRHCLNHTAAQYKAGSKRYGASGVIIRPKGVVLSGSSFNDVAVEGKSRVAIVGVASPKTTIHHA